MNSSETTNTQKDCADGGFIAFSKSFTPRPSWENFSPEFHGTPQEFRSQFRSTIHNQRNFNGDRRRSRPSYWNRYSQSDNGGNDWKNCNYNKKTHNNRKYGADESAAEYFHLSMLQDPWIPLRKQKSSERNTLIGKKCKDSETKDQDESGGSSSPSA